MLVLSCLLFLIAHGIESFYYHHANIYLIGNILDSFALSMLSVALYKEVAASHVKTRLLLMLVCFVSLCDGFSYIYLYDKFNYDLSTKILYMLGIFLVYVKISFLNYKSIDKYSKKGTYIAYKRPNKFFGYLTSIVYKYSTSFLIIDGKEFKFKNGIYKERKHVYNKNIYYKKIENIQVERARLMTGLKWHYKNNCFNIVRKLKNGKSITRASER